MSTTLNASGTTTEIGLDYGVVGEDYNATGKQITTPGGVSD